MLLAALLGLGPVAILVRGETDFESLRTRSESGDAEALNALGNIYASGQGVPQDFAQAIRYYTQAAARGHAPAQFNLGMMVELGRGMPADIGTAFKFYLKAAEQGFAPAQFNVGNMYANGIGVGRDYFEAALWFRQAAERGVTEAQYNLGLAYELGRGVAKDEVQAQRWYRQAADAGYVRARYNLALMLEDGRGSLPDQKKAAELYLAAARQNFAAAQNNYGIMLAEGRGGLTADIPGAFAWLSLAAENGAKPIGRDMLAQKLTSQQLSAANEKITVLRSEIGTANNESRQAVTTESISPQMATTAAANPTDGSASLANRIKNIEAELVATRTENTRLVQSARSLAKEKGGLEQQLAQIIANQQKAAEASGRADKLALQNSALVAQQHESALQIAALVSDLKSAQEATAKLRDDAVRSKVPSVAQADFETLREENIQLRRDHGQMLAQLKETRENLAAVTAANTRLAQADQTSKDSGPDSLRFRSLLEDNKRLNEEVKRSTAELSSLYRQVRELERKLEQGVSYKPSAAEGVSPEVADLNRQLDKLREENGNLTKENSRLAAASSNTVRPDEVEKLRRQIAEITTSRDALTGDKMALEKRLADFTGAAAKVGVDLTDLRSSAAETKRSLIDALREKEDLRAQLDSAKSGLSVQARRFEAQLSDIRKTAAAAVAPNSESERRLTEAIAQVVELRNELLEAKSKAAQIETKLRQSEMGAQKLAVELAPTKETVASLNAQLDEAKKALAQRTSATADAARLVEQLKTARSEVEKATNAAKTVSEEKFELTAKSAELAAQVLKVTAELKSAREAARKGTEASTQVAPLTKELAQSQANVAQAQAQLRDSESGAKKLAEQVGPMKAELARLSAQLDEAKTALNQKTSEAADAALLGGKLKTVQANFEVAAIAAKAAAEVREQLIAKSAEHAAQIQKLTADLANAREVVGKGAGAATQVAALNKELTEAKARAAQMETQLRVAEVGTKKLTEELAAAQNATAKSQNAAQQFEKIKQQLAQEQAIARSAGESELAKLRAKLADATQHLGNKETERAANEQSLRKALDEAGAQLASEKSSNEKLSKVSANLAEENHRLSDQVALLTEGRVTAVQNSVRGLAESRSLSEQLKKTNAELLEQNAKLTSDNEKISAQLTSAGGLTGQIDQLKSDLAAAQTAQASDKETLAKLNGQLDNAGKAITDLKGKNDELQKDLEVAKQSAAAALAAQAAAAKAAPETAALNLELQTLREHVRRLEGEIEDDRASSAREISSLAGQLQRTKESSRALAEANHALLESKNSDDSSVKADLEQLKAKIQTLMGENEKLLATKQQLAKENDLLAKDKRVAEQAADDAKKSAAAPAAWAQERDNLRTQVDDMFNKLSDSERRMAQLKQSSDAARTLAQNAQNEADKAQADLAALRSRLTESDKAVEQHNASVAELTGLNEKLSGEKTELQAQLVQSRQMMDKARDDISALKSRLTASDHMAEKSASSVSELSASNEKYTTQVKDLAAQIASLRADNARLPELGADVVAREKELSDVRSKLAESEKATELHRSSVAELSGVNDKLAVEKASLQKQLDAVNAELSMLRNDNSRLAQIEQRAASLEAVSAQLATSQRDIVSVRAENSRLNDTVQALDRDRTARITQLQQENSAIASRLRQAQGTLDQIANAARIINGTMGSSTSTVSPARPINSTELGAASSESRFHVVQEGDSLSRISVRYYGTANRWQDIYDANRELLKGENALRPGQRLRIP